MKVLSSFIVLVLLADISSADETQAQILGGVLGDKIPYQLEQSGLPWLYYDVPVTPKLSHIFNQLHHIVDPETMALVTVQAKRVFDNPEECHRHEKFLEGVLKTFMPTETRFENWRFTSTDNSLVGRLSCYLTLNTPYSTLRFEATHLQLFHKLNGD